MSERVCVVAILRDELKFVDEWLAYHRLLGIDHFYLYDDETDGALERHIAPHGQYATVIPWYDRHQQRAGRNKQVKAYIHSLSEVRGGFDWVCFLDVDEFVVLRRHEDIKTYLGQFPDAASVSLFWRMFGHNGHFNDPPGLVTTYLTRRRRRSGRQYKTFSRPSAIESITSAHQCVLRPGNRRLDANGVSFHSDAFETDPDGERFSAYVNHYYCRSFTRWMDRPRRGATTNGENLPGELWKSDPDKCLRVFVEEVAVHLNEHPDDTLAAYEDAIDNYLTGLCRP